VVEFLRAGRILNSLDLERQVIEMRIIVIILHEVLLLLVLDSQGLLLLHLVFLLYLDLQLLFNILVQLLIYLISMAEQLIRRNGHFFIGVILLFSFLCKFGKLCLFLSC
jgi:hypothetical protein